MLISDCSWLLDQDQALVKKKPEVGARIALWGSRSRPDGKRAPVLVGEGVVTSVPSDGGFLKVEVKEAGDHIDPECINIYGERTMADINFQEVRHSMSLFTF